MKIPSVHMGSKSCYKCGKVRPLINFSEYEICECEMTGPDSSTICTFCDKKVTKEDRDVHKMTCEERRTFFNKTKNPSFLLQF